MSTLKPIKQTRRSDEMIDSNWRRQVPARAKRLASMMQTGLWPRD